MRIEPSRRSRRGPSASHYTAAPMPWNSTRRPARTDAVIALVVVGGPPETP
jgi:hypothetical protein